MFKKAKSTISTAFMLDQHGISLASLDLSNPEIPVVVDAVDQEVDAANDDRLKEFTQTRRIKKVECATCLGLSEYQLVTMEAPDVPEEDLADALKWGVSEHIDRPMDDMAVDFFEIPSSNNISDKRYVNVVVVDRSIVEEKVAHFKQAGLKLRVIDIPELAIRNLINAYHLDENGVMFLHLARRNGLIVFVRDKVVYFSRRLEIGTDQLSQHSENRQNLALELQRSLDYFVRHFSTVGIKRLVIAPTNPSIPELAEFLDQNLGLQCVNFDFNKALNWKKSPELGEAPTSILSLGAALRIEEEE